MTVIGISAVTGVEEEEEQFVRSQSIGLFLTVYFGILRKFTYTELYFTVYLEKQF